MNAPLAGSSTVTVGSPSTPRSNGSMAKILSRLSKRTLEEGIPLKSTRVSVVKPRPSRRTSTSSSGAMSLGVTLTTRAKLRSGEANKIERR